MMEKAKDTAQSAMESMQQVCNRIILFFFPRLTEIPKTLNYIDSMLYGTFWLQTGQMMAARAQGAADSVKDAMGMKK